MNYIPDLLVTKVKNKDSDRFQATHIYSSYKYPVTRFFIKIQLHFLNGTTCINTKAKEKKSALRRSIARQVPIYNEL